MGAKKKKIGPSGRFGVGIGKVRQKLNKVEEKQRKKQECPFCGGRVKRKAKGIWTCLKCNKIFASGVYTINK